MSTHNIQFHDKIRTFTWIFVFSTYRKNFIGTQKRVRIIHGKRAIGVRAIEVLLYYSPLQDGYSDTDRFLCNFSIVVTRYTAAHLAYNFPIVS